MPDLVGEFCERLLQLRPTTDLRVIDQLCYQLREEFGGTRRYIRQCPELKATAPRVTRPRRKG
jgi:hypothetical protein